MRKWLFLLVIGTLAAAAYGEDATIIPEHHVRLSQTQNAGVTDDEVLLSWGAGAEYAPSHWLNMQLLWDPYLKFQPDIRGGSLFLGAKGYILGDGALVDNTQWLRLSAALGMFVPPHDKQPDLRDQDQNLWGSSLRLYSDFILSRYFFINLYFEGNFYPPQRNSSNDVFYGDWVRHYLDLTGELELHLVIPLNNGVVLKGGAPVRFFYAPWMNAADKYADSQYLLSAGAYFSVVLPHYRPPAEFCLRYNVHILGQNIREVHRISLITKVTLPPELLTLRLKTARNEE